MNKIKDVRKDAIGISSAIELKSNNYDLMTQIHIRNVCKAILGRYDQTNYALAVKATDLLYWLDQDYFVFRVSIIKELCEYLIFE